METLVLDYIKYYSHDTIGLQTLKRGNVVIKNIDQPFVDNDIDRYLDTLVRNIFELGTFERIFIPASFGPVFTDYLGFRLAYHIRLTQELGSKRFLPIVIYSSATLSDIFHCTTFIDILRTKGTYLIDLDNEVMSDYFTNQLESISSEAELQSIFLGIKLDLPKSYYDSHSVANEWGVYQLDRISGVNKLDEKDNPKFLSLYFKWLKLVSTSSRKRDEHVFAVEERTKVQIKVVGKIDLTKIKSR